MCSWPEPSPDDQGGTPQNGFVAQIRGRDSLSETSLLAGCDEQAETHEYRTTNWSSYNAALKKRRSLTVWFDPSMNWEEGPSDGAPWASTGLQRCRDPDLSDAEGSVQFCPAADDRFC